MDYVDEYLGRAGLRVAHLKYRSVYITFSIVAIGVYVYETYTYVSSDKDFLVGRENLPIDVDISFERAVKRSLYFCTVSCHWSLFIYYT